MDSCCRKDAEGVAADGIKTREYRADDIGEAVSI